MSPSKSSSRFRQLEADPARQQRDDELVERDALLGCDGDKLFVQGDGGTNEDLPVGVHMADNSVGAIDITSSACDITRMETTTTRREIPSAAEARQHPLPKTVRNAARAAERDGRPYFVTATTHGYRIVRSEAGLKFTTYFRVFGDYAERVEPTR